MSRVTEPVPEEVVRLEANGLRIATWTASPRALEPLGAGRLLALGFVLRREDLVTLRVARDGPIHRIVAQVKPERMAAATAEREHRAEHGCGLRYLLDCRPDLLAASPSARAAGAGAERDRAGRQDEPDARVGADLPDPATLPDLLRELFDRSPSRRTTGGHHTTALCDGRQLRHLHEVVGRHNGADKAIGGAFLAGEDLRRLGLLTTARISGEIAEKTARAGLAWVASRSVPTTLAVEIARAAGLPLIARAGGSDVRVFGRGEPESEGVADER